MDDVEKLAKQLEELDSMFDDKISELSYDDIMNKHGLDISELERSMGEYQPKMDLKFSSKEYDPNFAYPTDSGMDLYSTEDIDVDPFGRVLVPTGVHFDIPENYEIQVRTKSGLALNQGLMVLNSPGTVDQGYTGEIKVILMNMNNEVITVNKGQKIAQAVLCPVVSGKWVKLIEVKKLENKERSDNGFGSTGI